MQKYIGTAIKKDVNNPAPAGETPAVGVDVYVKLRSSGAIANIYSSNGSNPITQPLVTDANGRFEFYAANNRYDIEYSLPSGTVIDVDVILEDPTERKATTDEAKTGTNDNKFVTPFGVHQSFNQYGIGSQPVVLDTDMSIFKDGSILGGDVTVASDSPTGFSSRHVSWYFGSQNYGAQFAFDANSIGTIKQVYQFRRWRGGVPNSNWSYFHSSESLFSFSEH